MTRRDAFSGLRETNSGNVNEEVTNSNIPVFNVKQPLDLIPTAQRRKKKNRDWEQAHRAETVTYRGVPRELHEWVEEIAEGLAVPRDEVVRAFLEFSVQQYRCGQLVLIAYPKAQRMTLFPEGEKKCFISPSQINETRDWLNEAFPVATRNTQKNKKKKSLKDNKFTPRWEVRVTFRLPVSLKDEIRLISDEHTLPVGEIVWFFIEQALLAYRNGILPLEPVPKLVGKTLFQD